MSWYDRQMIHVADIWTDLLCQWYDGQMFEVTDRWMDLLC